MWTLASGEGMPRVGIVPRALNKLKLYVKLSKWEIGGLGSVCWSENLPVIDDVFIFRQKSTVSETELDPEHVARFLTGLIELDRDPSMVKLWWHSHGDAAVFWSQTDERTIESFANEFMISLVMNRRGESLLRVDTYAPGCRTIDCLRLEPIGPVDCVDDLNLEREVWEEMVAVLDTEKLESGEGYG